MTRSRGSGSQLRRIRTSRSKRASKTSPHRESILFFCKVNTPPVGFLRYCLDRHENCCERLADAADRRTNSTLGKDRSQATPYRRSLGSHRCRRAYSSKGSWVWENGCTTNKCWSRYVLDGAPSWKQHGVLILRVVWLRMRNCAIRANLEHASAASRCRGQPYSAPIGRVKHPKW